METKFFNLFFCLVFVISSYTAHTVNIKRGLSYDENAFLEGLSNECVEEQNNSGYDECLEKITTSNYKQVCSTLKTEKCQKFYTNPLDYFPICKNEPQFVELFQPAIMETVKLSFELKCQTDEEGNLCPFALSAILKGDGSTVLDDTCKSKICTDSTIKVYQSVNLEQISAYENLSSTSGRYSYDEINSFKRLVKMLESDECRSQHVTNVSNVTSNASYININSSLLIFLILLLLIIQ